MAASALLTERMRLLSCPRLLFLGRVPRPAERTVNRCRAGGAASAGAGCLDGLWQRQRDGGKGRLVRASVLNVAEGQDGKQKVILGSTP